MKGSISEGADWMVSSSHGVERFHSVDSVDSVEIDDAGFNKSAQLEEVMPVTAISREPRRIEAQDSSNLAGA